VVVKLDHNGGQAPLVFEVLERARLLDKVSENELEMVEPGAVGFRVPRDRMAAYKVQPSREMEKRKGGRASKH